MVYSYFLTGWTGVVSVPLVARAAWSSVEVLQGHPQPPLAGWGWAAAGVGLGFGLISQAGFTVGQTEPPMALAGSWLGRLVVLGFGLGWAALMSLSALSLLRDQPLWAQVLPGVGGAGAVLMALALAVIQLAPRGR